MPSHKRYEEYVITPVIEQHLKERGFTTHHEFILTLENFPKLSKRKPCIRYDLIASRHNEILLVEAKAAVYAQLVGLCIGELLVYKSLFDIHFDVIKRRLPDLLLTKEKKVKLYCAFPDTNSPHSNYSKWHSEHENLFKEVCKTLKVPIGLLLVKSKDNIPVTWEESFESLRERLLVEERDIGGVDKNI